MADHSRSRTWMNLIFLYLITSMGICENTILDVMTIVLMILELNSVTVCWFCLQISLDHTITRKSMWTIVLDLTPDYTTLPHWAYVEHWTSSHYHIGRMWKHWTSSQKFQKEGPDVISSLAYITLRLVLISCTILAVIQRLRSKNCSNFIFIIIQYLNLYDRIA